MADQHASPEANVPAAKNGKLENLEQAATINFRNELARKAIHLFSLSIPLIYYFISRSARPYSSSPFDRSFCRSRPCTFLCPGRKPLVHTMVWMASSQA